jgi:aminoglycoside 2'-N-acetyltransferase I
MTEVERLGTGGFALGALAASEQGIGLCTALGWRRWIGPTAALTPDSVVEAPGEAFVLPTPHSPPGLDPTSRLVRDWRRGDLW